MSQSLKEVTGGRRTHLLPSKNVGQPAEEELTDEGANRRRDLESKVLLLVELLLVAVDIANHDGGDVDGEDVVANYGGRLIKCCVRGMIIDARIGEEANASDDADLCMEPAEDIRLVPQARMVSKRETYEKEALSISASAARRRSSRT